MKTKKMLSLLTMVVCLCAVTATAQQEEETALDRIEWLEGPGKGPLGKIAEIYVPEGHVFAGGDDTRVLMEAMQNPVSGTEQGFLASRGSDWFLVFEFDEVGYIKDDEKDSLDAEAMLESIRQGNEAGNKIRAERGWPELKIIGWQQVPRYNPTTNNLEWAIYGESEGKPVVNWNTRLLGRKGVMKVTLVTAPEALEETLPYFDELMAGFSYTDGNRYAEYRQGDKVAKYGLTALVVGGATAVAAKTGLLKYIWKFLLVGLLAAGAFLKKLFGRKKAEGEEA
jgi:uncharacterized membrane-anchored protein